MEIGAERGAEREVCKGKEGKTEVCEGNMVVEKYDPNIHNWHANVSFDLLSIVHVFESHLKNGYFIIRYQSRDFSGTGF